MYLNIYHKNSLLYTTILVFTLCVFIFSKMVFSDIGDYPGHLELSNLIQDKKIPVPANFLPYSIINLSEDILVKQWIIIAITSISTTLKFLVTFLFTKHFLPNGKRNVTVTIALVMLVIFSIPNIKVVTHNLYYLTNFTTNVWHNTTIIFLMPFALLLYYSIFIKQQNVWIISLLVILNIIIKPSFIFIIIPLLLVVQIFDFDQKRICLKINWRYLTIISVCIITIIVEYLFLYKIKNSTDDKVVLDFFPFCNNYWDYVHIIITVVCSYFFPLMLIFFSLKDKIEISKYQLHSIALVVFALIINFSFVETGSRRYHGNFSWQIIPASYFLMLFSLISFAKNYRGFKTLHRYLLNFSISAHTFYGIFYIARILILNKYE